MTTPPPLLFNGARAVAGLEPAGLDFGRNVSAEICQALGSDRRDAQEFSALSQLFKRLEDA